MNELTQKRTRALALSWCLTAAAQWCSPPISALKPALMVAIESSCGAHTLLAGGRTGGRRKCRIWTSLRSSKRSSFSQRDECPNAMYSKKYNTRKCVGVVIPQPLISSKEFITHHSSVISKGQRSSPNLFWVVRAAGASGRTTLSSRFYCFRWTRCGGLSVWQMSVRRPTTATANAQSGKWIDDVRFLMRYRIGSERIARNQQLSIPKRASRFLLCVFLLDEILRGKYFVRQIVGAVTQKTRAQLQRSFIHVSNKRTIACIHRSLNYCIISKCAITQQIF